MALDADDRFRQSTPRGASSGAAHRARSARGARLRRGRCRRRPTTGRHPCHPPRRHARRPRDAVPRRPEGLAGAVPAEPPHPRSALDLSGPQGAGTDHTAFEQAERAGHGDIASGGGATSSGRVAPGRSGRPTARARRSAHLRGGLRATALRRRIDGDRLRGFARLHPPPDARDRAVTQEGDRDRGGPGRVRVTPERASVARDRGRGRHHPQHHPARRQRRTRVPGSTRTRDSSGRWPARESRNSS